MSSNIALRLINIHVPQKSIVLTYVASGSQEYIHTLSWGTAIHSSISVINYIKKTKKKSRYYVSCERTRVPSFTPVYRNTCPPPLINTKFHHFLHCVQTMLPSFNKGHHSYSRTLIVLPSLAYTYLPRLIRIARDTMWLLYSPTRFAADLLISIWSYSASFNRDASCVPSSNVFPSWNAFAKVANVQIVLAPHSTPVCCWLGGVVQEIVPRFGEKACDISWITGSARFPVPRESNRVALRWPLFFSTAATFQWPESLFPEKIGNKYNPFGFLLQTSLE